MFGIPIRLLVYLAVAAAVFAAALTIRQHYINAGWDRALETVKAQDAKAKDAADTAQLNVDRCYAANGLWSTITGKCTLEARP